MSAGGDGATWHIPGDADDIDDSALHDRMMFGDDTLDATSDAEALLGHDLAYKTSPADLANDM